MSTDPLAPATGRLLVSFTQQAEDDSESLRQRLTAEGGVESVDFESAQEDGFTPDVVMAFVILGVIGLGAITRLADWFRDRNDCLLVIDTRGQDLKIEERCDIAGRRGQVIVVTGGDEQVVIHRNDAVLNLQDLVEHAIGKSADTLAALVSSKGASAVIEKRSEAL